MVRVPERVTWKSLGSGVVLLDLDSGNYYVLNETATAIWQGVLKGRAAADIADDLLAEFDCTAEQAQADADEHLAYLVDEGLLLRS